MNGNVEEISYSLIADDQASAQMAQVGASADKATVRMVGLQNTMSRKLSYGAATLLRAEIMQMTGGVAGLDRVFFLLGNTMTSLLVKMGPFAAALAGGIALYSAIAQSARAHTEVLEKQRKTAEGLGGVFADLAAKSKATAKEDATKAAEYYDIAIKSLKQQIAELKVNNKEVMMYSKGIKEYATNYNEFVKLLLMVPDTKKIDLLDKNIVKYNELTAALQKLEAELKAVQALTDPAKSTWMGEGKGPDESAGRLMGSDETSTELGKVVAKAYETQSAEAIKANKKLQDNWKYTVQTMASYTEWLARQDKLTWAQAGQEFIIVWMSAITQYLEMQMVASIALQQYWKAAAISVGIIALAAIKGALERQMASQTESIIPENLPTALTAAGGALDSAAAIGGKTVSTSHQQVVNYITYSPRYGFLDPSSMNDATMKTLADKFGRFLMEGMASGQYGMTLA